MSGAADHETSAPIESNLASDAHFSSRSPRLNPIEPTNVVSPDPSPNSKRNGTVKHVVWANSVAEEQLYKDESEDCLPEALIPDVQSAKPFPHPDPQAYRPHAAEGGIGLLIQCSSNRVTIAGIVTGSPAHRSGKIAVHDVLEAVDAVPVAGREHRAVVAMLRGAVGTAVRLVLCRERHGSVATSAAPWFFEVVLERDALPPPASGGHPAASTLAHARVPAHVFGHFPDPGSEVVTGLPQGPAAQRAAAGPPAAAGRSGCPGYSPGRAPRAEIALERRFARARRAGA